MKKVDLSTVTEAIPPKIETVQSGIEITRAQLHQPFTVNGSTETTLYKHKGYTMVYHHDGLYCEFKKMKFIVPLANVVAMFP